MEKKKLFRHFMKGLIMLISFSIVLTSFIGILSSINIMANPNNLDINFNDIQEENLNFGPMGSEFNYSFGFNNDGLFDFQNFEVDVMLFFENHTSHENFTVLNDVLYRNNLSAQQQYDIPLYAGNESFIIDGIFGDLGSNWTDPEIQGWMEAYPAVNFTGVEILSFPYIMSEYDLYVSFDIRSIYNLGLVDFELGFEQRFTYADLQQMGFFPSDYNTWKYQTAAEYGVI